MVSYDTMNNPMKLTPLIAIFTGGGLGLVYVVNYSNLPYAAYPLILFSTGIIAWTIEQYGRHRLH